MNAAETGSGNEDAARFHDSLADPARFIPIRTGPTAKARLACSSRNLCACWSSFYQGIFHDRSHSRDAEPFFSRRFPLTLEKERGSRSNRPKPHRPITPPSSNQRRGTETGTQRVVDAISSSPANSSGLERRANLQSKKELRAEQLSRSTEELQESAQATDRFSPTDRCAVRTPPRLKCVRPGVQSGGTLSVFAVGR